MFLELDPPMIEIVPKSDPWNVLKIIQENELGINLWERTWAQSRDQSRDRSWDQFWNQSWEFSSECEYAFSGSYFYLWITSWVQGIRKQSRWQNNQFLSHLAFHSCPKLCDYPSVGFDKFFQFKIKSTKLLWWARHDLVSVWFWTYMLQSQLLSWIPLVRVPLRVDQE